MGVKYESNYYDQIKGSSTSSAGQVAPIVFEFVAPRSIVDVGCGSGVWLAEFQRLGASDVFGLDGPWVRSQQLLIPGDRFQVADLSKPISVGRRFDLVLNLEVAEHLPPEAAPTFVDSLARLGDVILFSAAIPFQGGEHHLNEQWPEYWASLFAQHGYAFVDCLRDRIWSNRSVAWWYAQNLFFVANKAGLDRHPKLAQASSKGAGKPLAIVHPRAYVENVARAKPPTELMMATLGAIRRKLLNRS